MVYEFAPKIENMKIAPRRKVRVTVWTSETWIRTWIKEKDETDPRWYRALRRLEREEWDRFYVPREMVAWLGIYNNHLATLTRPPAGVQYTIGSRNLGSRYDCWEYVDSIVEHLYKAGLGVDVEYDPNYTGPRYTPKAG